LDEKYKVRMLFVSDEARKTIADDNDYATENNRGWVTHYC
jgi:hypothetical protein